MSDTSKQMPYALLGSQLRGLRERNQESVAEVSGAVEIDEKDLALIESGKQRPTEDILLLLITHFAVEDEKAAELWQLAGYDQPDSDDDHDHDRPAAGAQRERGGQSQQQIMVMIDPRVMYSDAVEVVANSKGIVLNFSQIAGQNGQPLTVSRIGMSQPQAKMLKGLLHQALYDQENPRRKQLGDGTQR